MKSFVYQLLLIGCELIFFIILIAKFRKEIVLINLEDDFSPNETTGKYLNLKEFKEAILNEDMVVLDTRNDYEYDLGHLKGAIRPDIRNCANPECNRQTLVSEENEHKYLRSCSPECRKHEINRYVVEHNLSRKEWEERLNAIGENFVEEKRL